MLPRTEQPTPTTNPRGQHGSVLLKLVGSGFVGMVVMGVLIWALFDTIVRTGIIGDFDISLKSGNQEFGFKFNPNTDSIEDILARGLKDPDVRLIIGDAMANAIGRLKPDDELSKLFRDRFLRGQSGPFDNDFHWYRDITSIDTLSDIINLEKRMEIKTRPLPTKSLGELKRYLLGSIRISEGILKTDLVKARLSFPVGNKNTIPGGRAAICADSDYYRSYIVVTNQNTNGQKDIWIGNADIPIPKTACEQFAERGDPRIWVQLNEEAGNRLFPVRRLAEENGFIEKINSATLSALPIEIP